MYTMYEYLYNIDIYAPNACFCMRNNKTFDLLLTNLHAYVFYCLFICMLT